MITTLAGSLPASEDIFGTVTQLSVDGTTAVKAVAGLGILVFMLWKVFAGGFTISKLVVSAAVGALVAWLILGSGITTIQNRMGNQITNASAVMGVDDLVAGQAAGR